MTSPPSLLLPPEFTISATDREGGVRIVSYLMQYISASSTSASASVAPLRGLPYVTSAQTMGPMGEGCVNKFSKIADKNS